MERFEHTTRKDRAVKIFFPVPGRTEFGWIEAPDGISKEEMSTLVDAALIELELNKYDAEKLS